MGRRLQIVRLGKKLSRAQLSIRSGMSEQYIYQIEKKGVNIRVSTLARLLYGLGTGLVGFVRKSSSTKVRGGWVGEDDEEGPDGGNG